ncbi:ABC transporter ATP-binding protein [Alkaliphilus oremlandii]|uniref:ABC transporter related n=1 Tax=Alkaliphilus oremlandii (strain OhILAs) TaxID=350688 RepID=A8MFV9_ALKOO|nr:ABC transporter ATP-binding protein [Alkaliphilus oremlandii]ABW18497.1 ABC transporter related [Alkaliphilus oremlandii OhILAs]
MSFLVAKDLKVGYAKRTVVDQVNFELKKGEIICLLGPNGCGKSTIIKSIIDHIKILDGSLTVLGRDINAISGMERAKEMSVVLTERIAPEMMTAMDVVATGRYPHTNHFGKLLKRDMDIIQESLHIVNGEELKDKEFRALSDGEKQRIMIARAICQESDIMILDEPTSFLDIRYKIDLLDILSKLAIEKEKTIILSLHEIELVPKIADQVLLIKNGAVYQYGSPEDVITDEAIKEVYNISIGSFDTTLGNIELPKATHAPKVFVIGGGGKATKIYRALSKKNMSFYSGILFENDIDYSVSRALGYDTIAEDSFTAIEGEKLNLAKAYIKECDIVIDSGVSLSGINKGNYDLLKFASQEGLRIMSLRNEDLGLNTVNFESISSLISAI